MNKILATHICKSIDCLLVLSTFETSLRTQMFAVYVISPRGEVKNRFTYIADDNGDIHAKRCFADFVKMDEEGDLRV